MAGERAAFEEAVRTSVEQQATVDSLHTRAAVLVSAAAVATAFLADLADIGGTGHSGLVTALTIGAVASFIGVLLMAGLILWPRTWRFQLDVDEILKTYSDPNDERVTDEGVHYHLARDLARLCTKNEEQLGNLWGWYEAGTILIGAEVVLWLLAAWGR